MSTINSIDLTQLANDIKAWGCALGFQQIGISDIDLNQHEYYLQQWINKGYHGSMEFMQAHGNKRARPAELVPGTLRVISARMDYLPPDASFAKHLGNNQLGYVSRYALGRDYHKVIRNKLAKLGEQIKQHLADTAYRPFVDSAPVLEHAIAEKAGLGWTGKHSLTINREAGSWFFLGELFINLPLPIDEPVKEQCGECVACLTICPTNAIVEPYVVDARKCISYLTIEHNDVIPEQFRTAMGNRIYGCDDCQLICPWNRYAQITQETDFHAREHLHGKNLLELFSWDEKTFLKLTEGSAIRRIGWQKWQRNIAVALGNADFSIEILTHLEQKLTNASPLVAEHIRWAIEQQLQKKRASHAHSLVYSAISSSRKTLRLTRAIEKGLPRDA